MWKSNRLTDAVGVIENTTYLKVLAQNLFNIKIENSKHTESFTWSNASALLETPMWAVTLKVIHELQE